MFETSNFSCWASNLLTHLSRGQGSRQIEHPVTKALTKKNRQWPLDRRRENCLSKVDDLKFKFFFSAFFCLLYTIEIYNVISGKLNWQLYHPPFIKYATSSRGIEWYFKKRGCWKILAWSGNPRSVDGSWSFVFRWFLCLGVSIFFLLMDLGFKDLSFFPSIWSSGVEFYSVPGCSLLNWANDSLRQ